MNVNQLWDRVKWITLILVLAAIVFFSYRLNYHPSLEPYKALYDQTPSAKGSLNITWFGVSTLLFDDGKTAILIDGFFTRPSRFQTFFGKVGPDRSVVERALVRAGIKSLAAVITVHSHYDHAMDSPLVAELTGADLVGSPSTVNIGRGWGLPESKLRVIQNTSQRRYGDFHITFIQSKHNPSPFGDGGEILGPLTPPVRAKRYYEGGSFSVLIEHRGKRVLVHASAGFLPGALKDTRADVVFLGIANLGNQRPVFRNAYWREVVESTRPRTVVPIHWDDFWLPAEPITTLPRLFDDFDGSMRFILSRGKASAVEIKFVEYGKPIGI